MAIKADIKTEQGLEVKNAYVRIHTLTLSKRDPAYIETPSKKGKPKRVLVRKGGYQLEYIYIVFTSPEKRKEAQNNHIPALRKNIAVVNGWNGKGNPYKAAYDHLKTQEIFEKAVDC